MVIWRSDALAMSYIVSAAILTAVKASISTPVLLEVLAYPSIFIDEVDSSIFSSTVIFSSGNGCHKGISSDVFFAPMIPAN